MATQEGHIVWGTVRIADSDILLPVVLHDEVQGGFHAVQTLSDRNAIPTHVRAAGMIARVWNDGSPSNNGEYVLIPGTTSVNLGDNGNWVAVSATNNVANKLKVDCLITDATKVIDWSSIITSFGNAPGSIMFWVKQDDNTYQPTIVQSSIDTYPANTLTVYTNNLVGFLIIMWSMKKIFFLVLLSVAAVMSYGQTLPISADTVKLTKKNTFTELWVMNSTDTVPGFLFNIGNGKTQFKRALTKINDSTYLVGVDTLHIKGGSGGGGGPTYTPGTGISIVSNVISNTGVLSYNGRTGVVGPVVGDYSSFYYPLASNPAGYITGNQPITVTNTGDVQGSASATTNITVPDSVKGIWGRSVPTPTKGILKYNSGTLSWDSTFYSPLDTAATLLTKTNFNARTVSVSQVTGGGVIVTGSGAQSMGTPPAWVIKMDSAVAQTRFRSDTAHAAIRASLTAIAQNAISGFTPLLYNPATGLMKLRYGAGLLDVNDSLRVDSAIFATQTNLNAVKARFGGTPGFATYLTAAGGLYTFPILNDSAAGLITFGRTLNFDGNVVSTAINYSLGTTPGPLWQVGGNKTGSVTTIQETPQVTGGLAHYISNNNASNTASVNDNWQTLIRQDVLHTDFQLGNPTMWVHGLPFISSGSNRYTWGTLTNYNGYSYTTFNKMLQYDSLGRFYILNTPQIGSGSDVIVVRSAGGELKTITQSSLSGTLNRVAPIDSLTKDAKGLQVAGPSIVPQSADATFYGMMSPLHWRVVDSLYNRLIRSTVKLGHPGAGIWSGYASSIGDTLYQPNLQQGFGMLVTAQNDSSRKFDVDQSVIATVATVQTLTNKTLTTPVLSNPTIISLGSSSDAVTYLPVASDGSGNLRRMTTWSGSGGGNQLLSITQSAFADTIKISGGNQIVQPGADHNLAGLLTAADKSKIDSIVTVNGTGHGVTIVRAPYTRDSIIISGVWTSAKNYLTANNLSNRDSAHFQIVLDTTSLFGRTGIQASVAEMRARAVAPPNGQVYYVTDANQAGFYVYDATDNTSADNLGTVLVDAGNRRYKRKFSGPLYAKWFGVVGDGSTDMTTALQTAIDYAAAGTSNTKTLILTEGTGNIMVDTITLKPGIVLKGDNVRLRISPNNSARKYIFGIPSGPVDQWGMSDFQVIMNAGYAGQGCFNFTGVGQGSSPFNGGVWHLIMRNIQIQNCSGHAFHFSASDGAGDIANQFLNFEDIRVYNTADTTARAVFASGQLGQTTFRNLEAYGAGSVNLNTCAIELNSLGTSNDQIQGALIFERPTVQAYHDAMRTSNAQGVNVSGGWFENDSLGVHLTNRSTVNFLGNTWKNVGVGTNAYIIGDDLSHSTFIGNYVYGNVNRWYTSPSGTAGGIDFYGNNFQTNGTVTSVFTGQTVSVVSNAISLAYFKDIIINTTTSTSAYVNTINSNAAPGELISIRANDPGNGGVVMLTRTGGGNINVNNFGVNGMVILRDRQAAILKRSDALNTWNVVAVSNQDLYAAAAPTTGLYFAGEVIHNSVPTHTSSYEWVITSTGVCPSCGIDSVMMAGAVASGVGTVQDVGQSNVGNPLFSLAITGTPTVHPVVTVTPTAAPANTVLLSLTAAIPSYAQPILTSSLFHDQGGVSAVLHGSGPGANPTWGAVNMATDMTGTMLANQFPALQGDVTTPVGSLVTTIANQAVTNAKIANATIDLTSKVTNILQAANGGTGVNNAGKLITLGGNLTTSGAFPLNITLQGSTSVTFPTSGTILNTTGVGSGLSGITYGITGTANQVLVNNTVGTAQTGSITLTTAQNIGTTSTPTFSGITLNGNTTNLSSSAIFSNGTVGFNGTIGSGISIQAAINDGGFTGSGQTRPLIALASFYGPAISAANTSVGFTDAATVYIDGPPTASTNTSLTNPLALAIRLGKARFSGGIQVNDGSQGAGKVAISDANGNMTWGTAGTGTVSLLYSEMGLTQVINTTSQTSFMSAGYGTNTLGANYLTAGKTIRIHLQGTYTTLSSGVGNFTMSVKLGGVSLVNSAITNLPTSALDQPWAADINVTCPTPGTSGAVFCTGELRFANGSSGYGVPYNVIPLTILSSATINTTINNNLDVLGQWSVGSTSNAWKCVSATIEALN